jgi:hypothetical protein
MSASFPLSGTRQEMERWLRRRAGEDAEFRARLVNDTRALAEELTGRTVPAEVELIVIDPGPETTYLVRRIDGTPLAYDDATNIGDTVAALLHLRSFEDPSIWSAAAESPHPTLQSLGVGVPGGMHIEVLDETPARFYLVLDPLRAAKMTTPAWSFPESAF